jgi:sugar phosphate isomerase/epimerase
MHRKPPLFRGGFFCYNEKKTGVLKMKFGYCMDVKFLHGDEESRTIFEAVANAGFDYVELPFSALSELSREEIASLKNELKKIPCLACNLFFPPPLKIVGPDTDTAGIDSYLARMLPFAAEMGIETLVFGNGGARKIPAGSSRESVFANLRSIVEKMDVHAAKYGIKISVEPLNTTETNIINSYGEADILTEMLQNVATMIDSYHVAMENQTYDDVLQSPSRMLHLHTAYPIGRRVPNPSDDMRLYESFIATVKKIGYNDKINYLVKTLPDNNFLPAKKIFCGHSFFVHGLKLGDFQNAVGGFYF